ncbi:MAG TPA: alkaline phosphatase family protein, partial [Acidimicrobiales bacterium]|nr:alkaline phosphatase family protein [Acidimicrobiales bacterium]
AYWDGVDRIAHEFGFTDRYFTELEECDLMVAELLRRLPSNVALIVTSDHGQVEVGDRMIELTDDLNDLLSKQSGEARFRWLHALDGSEQDLLQIAKETFEDVAWIMSKKEIIDEGWLGSLVDRTVEARLGDVALIAREKIGFTDPAEKMPFKLITRHGSLTKEEMHVPLLSAVT